ncbi:MAG: sigma-70 family RNA polymerase sigma factor [Anaerolineae bacterium]|nr:sigma-70 family RNA polymerase sigma factor [Anaerolineae bacterium]
MHFITNLISPPHAPEAIDAYLEFGDKQLVLACRRGEAAAWSVLVNRYQRLIYSIPRRAGLDEDHAGEVFQRTFFKLMQNLHQIEHPERVRAWLVTTARRETLRLIQQVSAEQPLSSLDVTPDEEHDRLPGEDLERLEEQHLIQQALAQMDERCRHLLLLLFFRPEPVPYAQISAALGMAETSLSPTRTRCLQKLRRILREMDF